MVSQIDYDEKIMAERHIVRAVEAADAVQTSRTKQLTAGALVEYARRGK